jgi:prepilin-type N-terminal cleavage/methylation domain-containing protein
MKSGIMSLHRGFSLLELVIVIILVVILFAVAVDRLMPLRGEAEAAHVASTIGSLRSALGLEAARQVTREGIDALPALATVNPMTLLQQRPDQYAGARASGRADDYLPGSWYFESDTGMLAYRVRFPQYLDGSPTQPVILRWSVDLQFDDQSGSGAFDPEHDRLHGIALIPTHTHRWPPRR